MLLVLSEVRLPQTAYYEAISVLAGWSYESVPNPLPTMPKLKTSICPLQDAELARRSTRHGGQAALHARNA